MSFTATVGYEYPSKLGPPLVYTTRYDVTMQRPDKLRIISPGDGPASEFYYDGKTMTRTRRSRIWPRCAEHRRRSTLALDAAFKNAAIFFPFVDLLAADPYAALTEGAILAFYIGQSSSVGGTKTDMVAWANKDVFLQIWIGADDKLPRRIRAMYAADPLRAAPRAGAFQLAAGSGRLRRTHSPRRRCRRPGRMAFAAPAPPPRGMKPLTAGKSTKPAPTAPAKAN